MIEFYWGSLVVLIVTAVIFGFTLKHYGTTKHKPAYLKVVLFINLGVVIYWQFWVNSLLFVGFIGMFLLYIGVVALLKLIDSILGWIMH